MRILALDFGGSAVKYGVIDENVNITNEGSRPAPLESKEQYVETIVDIYNEVGAVDGVAISAPGYIDPETGYVDGAGAYMQMMHTNIYDLLKNVLPVPVSIENDGKSAALAEAWNGALKDVKDGVVMVIGTGYAGGVIHNGRVLRGKKHMAGEFSCMGLTPSLNMDTTVCGSGSMCGLILKANMALGIDVNKTPFAPYLGLFFNMTQDPSTFTELNDDPRFANGIDGPLFFELLDEGNEACIKLYDEFIDAIASALMNVQCILDPEVIALGGGFIKQERVIPDLQKRVDKFDSLLGGGLAPHINVVKCLHGSHANLIGAVYNFMQLRHMVNF